MKSNTSVITLTAIAFLFGARTLASAQSSHPQAASPAVANPASRASFGTPLLIPIDQARSVSASAASINGGLCGEQYDALDFGPFSAHASAFCCGFATSQQHSEILEDGIVAYGTTYAEWGGPDCYPASSFAWIQVRFSVADPVSYNATGYIHGGRLELQDQLGPLLSISGFSNYVDESGLLMPGEYVFDFFQRGSLTDPSQRTYDLTFELEPCDTTPPVLSYPSSVSVVDEKGGTPGKTVFFSVTAADAHDPSPTVVCVPPSGSFFPHGTTMVTCTATDASGNQAACIFPVVVLPTVRKHRL